MENCLSFKEYATWESMKPVSVIIGQNNVGKSNVFKIIKFLKDLASGSVNNQTYYEFLHDKKGESITLDIIVQFSPDERKRIIDSDQTVKSIFNNVSLDTNFIFKKAQYKVIITSKGCVDESLIVSDENNADTLILKRVLKDNQMHYHATDLADHIKASGKPEISEIELKNKAQGKVGFGIFIEPSSALEYKVANLLRTSLQQIKIYGANRRAEIKVPGGEQKELQESGSNLIGVLNTIQGVNSTEFVRIMNIYRNIIGGIKSVNLPPIGKDYTVRLDEIGLESQTDFADISTGLHQLMILIVAIEQSKNDQIILIEEPEIHLHASSQKRLFQFIHQKSESNQIIITTHSPIFTGVDNSISTHLITRDEGISKITHIDKIEDLKFIKQQLGIRNSDVYGNDYTIFVEGESEEIAFPIVANSVGFDKFGQEVKLVNLKGNSKILKLELFLEYLKNQDTGAFIIADGDGQVSHKVDDFIRRNLIPSEQIKIWKKEFEDTFSVKEIIEAMKDLAKEKSFQFTMTDQELDEGRKSDLKTAKIINDYLNTHDQGNLVKVDLARQLASNIVQDITNNNSDRIQTEFEKEVRKIMNIVNLKYDQTSSTLSFDVDKIPDEEARNIYEKLKQRWNEDL